jgi:hypothetical protein
MADMKWILLVASLLLVMFSGIALWRGWGHISAQETIWGRIRLFRRMLSTIPDETQDDDTWNAWLLKVEALLRGIGLKREFDSLASIIRRTEAIERREIAKSFFHGLAHKPKGYSELRVR